MATSIFDVKESKPTENDLEKVLKENINVWNVLFDYLESNYGSLEKEWKFYSKAAGWTLRISDEKGKNIVFLAPNDNYFLVQINMSAEIRDQILKIGISKENKKILEEAKIYCEGTGGLFSIKELKDLDDIKTILSIRDN